MKQHAAHRAFTLVEMLIVVAIIGILMAIALVIGRQVGAGAKATATTGAIGTLQAALTEYAAARESNPGPIHEYKYPSSHPSRPNDLVVVPVADARIGGKTEMINSIGWFTEQTRAVPSSRSLLTGMNQKFIRQYDEDPADDSQAELLTITDAWGRPLRYVHPKFDGEIFGNYPAPNPSNPSQAVQVTTILGSAPNGLNYAFTQIRRNAEAVGSETADSDGGICQGDSPYFYSAGPDGDPSTIDDNVYSVKPKFRSEG